MVCSSDSAEDILSNQGECGVKKLKGGFLFEYSLTLFSYGGWFVAKFGFFLSFTWKPCKNKIILIPLHDLSFDTFLTCTEV